MTGPADLRFKLRIDDYYESTTTVHVYALPDPDAGSDQQASPGMTVVLDGTGSFAPPPLSPLTHAWIQHGAGCRGSHARRQQHSRSFTALPADKTHVLHFDLTVTTANGSDTATVAITVPEPGESEDSGCGPGWGRGLAGALLVLLLRIRPASRRSRI